MQLDLERKIITADWQTIRLNRHLLIAISDIALQKQSALDSAYHARPERFASGQQPKVAMP
uniref:hypothetical protein n=1 Tax=Thiolapillus sp. TaxID=2017437 RepID=UPI003AF40E0C